MSLDAEKDKLNAKIQWFKEHLNSTKTAEELDAEFEEWYTNVKAIEEEKERMRKLNEDIQDEAEIRYYLENKSYDHINYSNAADLKLSRPCTLQAFTNTILMKSYCNNFHGSIDFEDKCYCKFNKGRVEYSKDWWCYKDAVLNHTKGKYFDSISGEHKYTVYQVWIKKE